MTSHLSGVDLLRLGDADRKKPWLNYYWPNILGAAFGVVSGCFVNYQTRRPAFSGIQKHIVFVVGYTVAITLVNNRRLEYYAEKDAVYRHYIDLHPEEFLPEPRKKIAEIIEPWIPIR